jgi:protease I
VTIDKSIDDVSPHDFDALLIPGGNSPSQLRLDERFVNFVRHFANLYKPIFCICSAPLLLIDANVVKGRRLTTQDYVSDDLIQAGAVYLNEAVVNDNNLYISSRSTTDLGAFIHESLNVLRH